MSCLTIYRDNYVDYTVVSNSFIDEYMSDANDAQLKIYLYLIRMLSANKSTSVSDMADKFNHTEKDVVRALKYWEKKGLLQLDFDQSNNLEGIHLLDFCASCQHASRETAPVIQETPAEEAAQEDSAVSLEKPSYSLDQLREFKERQSTSQLLFIAQSYIGKPLSPSEIQSIMFYADELHFSEDLIDYLLQYCVDRGKKSFKYIDTVAISWARQGITTPKEAQGNSYKYEKYVYTIMNELGKNDVVPTDTEVAFINRWVKEYGFSMDVILEACKRTVLATDRHRFEYTEGILSSWLKENVHHKADIQKIDDLYQKRKASAPKAGSNRFNQFTQTSYDFEALERKLLRS